MIYFIFLLPLLGYILSKWINEEPKGLFKQEVLSTSISQNPSWHLPIVIIGFLMSFLINVFVYSVFAITVIITKFIEFIKWLYHNILEPIWNVIKKICIMIAEIIVMIIKISIHYLVKIPLDILIKVINSVTYTLNWSNYYRTFKVIAIGSFAAGFLIFIGHLSEIPQIGSIGSPFVLAITLTWVVGLVSFGNHQNGKRAAIFALSVIGLILSIFALLYVTNLLDSITSWGGVFAGLLYSPSLVSISLAILLIITVVFITNVGAIYINSDAANLSFTDNLKGCLRHSFNRSWSFIVQPIFAIAIGALIVIIPYLLLNFSADSVLKEKIVSPTLSSTFKALNEELNKININPSQIINDVNISQAEFDKAILDVEKKIELELKISENTRYSSYFSKAIINGITYKIEPVATAKEIEDEINKSKKDKDNQEKSKLEAFKNIDAQLAQSKASGDSDPKKIADLNTKRQRTDKYYNSEIAGLQAKIKYQEGNSIRYNLTYLFFLLSSGILYSILIALIANIYAASVKPVYEMWSSNFIIEKVNEARSKNMYQPWVGILLIGLLALGSGGFGSKSINGIKMMLMSKEISDTTFTGDADDLEAREQAISDSIASAEEAANQAAADAEAAAAQEMRRSDSIAAAASYQMNGEPYTVNSEKCYFYTEPNINTKRSAYLVYGETVYPMERRDGFFYVEFTNPSGQTTKGWVQDSDLNSL